MSFDTVIIGAGMSGLAAGIRLAYFDRKVCLLERHTTIGGLNSFYRLRNRNYDVGLHAVTNYAAPGTKTGPLSKLLRQLRLHWDDFGLCPQRESAVVFPGHTLRFNNDFELLRQQVAAEFPRQIDNFDRLRRRIDEHDELNLNRKELSARAVVQRDITDPVLEDMLFCPLMYYGSATPRDMDFSQFVIMFKSIFYEGFGRPFEGIRLILKKLVRQFKSLGGQLWLRSGVKSIHVDRNRATAVELDDGRIVEAHNVLSSAGAAETMRLCGQNSSMSTTVQAGDISFIEAISVLDRQPADFGYDKTIVFFNDSDRFHYERPGEPCDLRSGVICSPNNFEYKTPLSDGRIRLTSLANPDFWLQLPPERYAEEKEKWYRWAVESALRYLPDFREFEVDRDMFTPRTIKRFTGHFNGCVYGAPQKFVDGRTPVDNLYVCGTDQGFLGIVGAMLSGITIANRYLLAQ